MSENEIIYRYEKKELIGMTVLNASKREVKKTFASSSALRPGIASGIKFKSYRTRSKNNNDEK